MARFRQRKGGQVLIGSGSSGSGGTLQVCFMPVMQDGYMHLMRGARTAGALAAVCVATACNSTSAATLPAAHASSGIAASGRVTSSPRGGSAAGGTPTRTATAPAAGAVAASEPAPRVSLARVRTADGSIVTVATFRGPVRYVLHNGSADPGPAAAGLVRAGPAVTGGERARLLAAFNGGFKLSAGAGGYEQEGHVISPLLRGLASLVIDRSGRARIGVWGHGLPAPGEAVYSVRQNLQLLVERGRPTQAAADWGLWGATLGGGEYVARSALGQDASGDLMYAASMSATPADLARGASPYRSADGDGARHQSRVGPARCRPPTWRSAHRRGAWPGPPGRPVPGGLGPGLHHRHRPPDRAAGDRSCEHLAAPAVTGPPGPELGAPGLCLRAANVRYNLHTESILITYCQRRAHTRLPGEIFTFPS